MKKFVAFCLALMLANPVAFAQEQQAGNQASANADQTFQALIDKCDNIDMMMLRARVRVEHGRTTEEAQAKSTEMVNEAFALCGEGKVDEGKALLQEAYDVAKAGVDERFVAESNETEEKPAEVVDAKAEVEEASSGEEETSMDSSTITYIIIGVVVVLILGFLVFRRDREAE
jgi:hypothetical protein